MVRSAGPGFRAVVPGRVARRHGPGHQQGRAALAAAVVGRGFRHEPRVARRRARRGTARRCGWTISRPTRGNASRCSSTNGRRTSSAAGSSPRPTASTGRAPRGPWRWATTRRCSTTRSARNGCTASATASSAVPAATASTTTCCQGRRWNKDELVRWAGADSLDRPDPASAGADARAEDGFATRRKDRAEVRGVAQAISLRVRRPAAALQPRRGGVRKPDAGRVRDSQGAAQQGLRRRSSGRRSSIWSWPTAATASTGIGPTVPLFSPPPSGRATGTAVPALRGEHLLRRPATSCISTMAAGPARVPAGRSLYAGGATGVAILRRDGFASMDAGEEAGTLTTRPLTFRGKYLFVNADAPQGELRAEVLDETGRPIAPTRWPTASRCEPTPRVDDSPGTAAKISPHWPAARCGCGSSSPTAGSILLGQPGAERKPRVRRRRRAGLHGAVRHHGQVTSRRDPRTTPPPGLFCSAAPAH